MRRDQALHDERIWQHRERGQPCDKAHHQDQRAIGAEPAVAHDLELRRTVAAAAETVCDIGEAVLVQRAGQDRAGAERKRCRGQIRHADHAQAETKQAHRGPDRGADNRKHPVRPDEILLHRPLRMRHRQPGQEGDRGSEIVEPVIHVR